MAQRGEATLLGTHSKSEAELRLGYIMLFPYATCYFGIFRPFSPARR